MRTLLAEEIARCEAILSDYRIEPEFDLDSFKVYSLDPDLRLVTYEVDVVDGTCTCKGYVKRGGSFLCRHLLLCLNFREQELFDRQFHPDLLDPREAAAERLIADAFPSREVA